MKDLRKELIDFCKWYYNNDEDDMFVMSIAIDCYLQSINSSPCERKADSNNEDEKEEFIKLCMCSNPEYKDGKCINCGDADWEFE